MCQLTLKRWPSNRIHDFLYKMYRNVNHDQIRQKETSTYHSSSCIFTEALPPFNMLLITSV